MGKITKGSIVQPSTFLKNNSAPLDDRQIVYFVNDLINPTTWTVGVNDTRYQGMMVFVIYQEISASTYENLPDPFEDLAGFETAVAALGDIDEMAIYYLKDFDNRNLITGWQKMGNSSVTIRTW